MTSISALLVALFIVLPLVQLTFDYRLKYINKDGRTTAHIVNRRWLFWVTVCVGLITSINNALKDYRAAAAQTGFNRQFQNERETSAARMTNMTTNFEARISVVTDKQVGLLRELQRLSMAIATNSGMDPRLRGELLDAQKQLEGIDTNIVDVSAWISELQRSRAQVRLESSVREQSFWDEGLPVYEYALRTLERMLTDIGKQTGERPFSNFKNLPSVVPPLPFNAAVMSLGTNSGHKFSAKIGTFIHTQLHITSTCSNETLAASLRIQVYDGTTVVDVEAPSQQNIEKIGTAKSYKESVDWGLRNFLAAHMLQCSGAK